MLACGAPILECNERINLNQHREEVMTTRRTIIKQGVLGAATLTTATAMPWRMLRAQPKPVKIAVCVPLSGPWARQGTLIKWGAETAASEINASGGIKSMGGAKIELL